MGFGDTYWLKKPYVIIQDDYDYVYALLEQIEESTLKLSTAPLTAPRLTAEYESVLRVIQDACQSEKNITFETWANKSSASWFSANNLISYTYVVDIRPSLDGSTYMIDLRKPDHDDGGANRYTIRLDRINPASFRKYFP